MDGVLDEEAWKNALVLELAYEIDPGENTPAPVKTECLLTYDSAGLHADPQTLIFVGYSDTRDNENAIDLEQRGTAPCSLRSGTPGSCRRLRAVPARAEEPS